MPRGTYNPAKSKMTNTMRRTQLKNAVKHYLTRIRETSSRGLSVDTNVEKGYINDNVTLDLQYESDFDDDMATHNIG